MNKAQKWMHLENVCIFASKFQKCEASDKKWDNRLKKLLGTYWLVLLLFD